jgi:hypothetical protein
MSTSLKREMSPISLGFAQFINALPLAYGVANDDLVDEHIRIGESSCPQVMHEFCKAVVVVFSEHCYRGSNVEDMATGNSRFFLNG